MVAIIKRYRNKMKPDTDKYEQMKKKGKKNNMKIKERKKNDIAMPKMIQSKTKSKKKKTKTKQNKQRKPHILLKK